MPRKDSPVIFGLHPNADLTFRLKESIEMVNTLIDTQPKDTGGGSGKSREEEVKEKLEKELIPMLPADFIELDIKDRLRVMKGPRGLTDTGLNVPLNVFLSQELQRFQMILTIVRTTMHNMVDAIEGSIIMTPDIVEAINAVFDYRVPKKWVYDPTGAEIAWLTNSLAAWIKGLLDRHFQLNGWISKERPPSFWMTGFFNPQGFLTAMKQEVTRQNKAKSWSLDEVNYQTDVMKDVITSDDGRIEGKTLTVPPEGVLVHGLYMEGAAWNKGEKRLEDSAPKELFFVFPIIHVYAVSSVTGGGPGGKGKMEDRFLDKSHYNCPVYKYPKRNDRYLIFRVYLKGEGQGQQSSLSRGVTASMNWTLKGVALLCQKD